MEGRALGQRAGLLKEGGASVKRAGHKVRGRGTRRREGGAPVQRAKHQAIGRSTRPEGPSTSG